MVDDDDAYSPDANELEQLARSIVMDGSVGRHDAQVIAEASWCLATIERHRRYAWVDLPSPDDRA